MGGDPVHKYAGSLLSYFNPRPPHGGRLGAFKDGWHNKNFNPRPPHGGRLETPSLHSWEDVFQSTPPAWGATYLAANGTREWRFQSTPPAWGATGDRLHGGPGHDISIHAPRMGGDGLHQGGAHRPEQISIHAPRMGGDRPPASPARRIQYFNPRPPHGGRLTSAFCRSSLFRFQSTPPAWGATAKTAKRINCFRKN